MGLALTGTSIVININAGPGNEHDYGQLKSHPLQLGLFDMTREPESEGKSVDANAKDMASMPDTTREPESEGEKVMKRLGFYGDKAYTGVDKDFKSVNSQVLHKGINKESLKEIKKAYKTGDIARMAKALGLSQATR